MQTAILTKSPFKIVLVEFLQDPILGLEGEEILLAVGQPQMLEETQGTLSQWEFACQYTPCPYATCILLIFKAGFLFILKCISMYLLIASIKGKQIGWL